MKNITFAFALTLAAGAAFAQPGVPAARPAARAAVQVDSRFAGWLGCWRLNDDLAGTDWDKSFAAIKALLLQRFAEIHSYALQQTLYGMGEAVLEQHPDVAEIKFSAPNKHHFLVDFSGFEVDGLENNGEVFIAADRPYGLIECTVLRDSTP